MKPESAFYAIGHELTQNTISNQHGGLPLDGLNFSVYS